MTTPTTTSSTRSAFYFEGRLQNIFWTAAVLMFAGVLALAYQLPVWLDAEATLLDIVARFVVYSVTLGLGVGAIVAHRQRPYPAAWMVLLLGHLLSAAGIAFGNQGAATIATTSAVATVIIAWLIFPPRDYLAAFILQVVATVAFFGAEWLNTNVLTSPVTGLLTGSEVTFGVAGFIIVVLIIGRFLPNRLAFRLGFSTLFVAAVPVLLTLLISQTVSLAREVEVADTQLESVRVQEEGEIEAWIDNLSDQMLLVIHPAQEGEVAKWLTGTITDEAIANEIVAEQRNNFTATLGRTGDFQEIFIVDLSGRVIVSTDGSQTGRDYSTAPFFITTVARSLVDVIATDYIYVQPATVDDDFQPITLNPNASNLFVLVARPVLDEQRNLAGLVVGRATLDTLIELMGDTTGLGETGESYIISRTGELLSRLRFADTAIGEQLNTPVTELIRAGSRAGSAQYFSYRDDEVRVSYQYLADLDAVLVVERSENEISAPRENLLITSGVVALLAIVLGSAIGISVTQLINTPIARLTRTATTAAAGDLSATAEETGGTDELNLLARSYNTMTRQLRQVLENLEQQVADRTRALEIATEVGRELSSARDLQTLMESAVTLIADRYNLYHTQIYLADPSERVLILRAGTGEAGQELLARNHRLPIGPGSLNGRAASDRNTVVVPDTQASATFFKNPLLPDTRSEMAVPLVSGGRLLGVLDMQSAAPNALNDDNVSAFEVLAASLATAIENANLFAEQQKVQQQAEARAQTVTRAGWADYLDATHRPERLGFAYDLNTVAPLDTPIATNTPHALTTAITIGDVPVGVIQLQDEEGRVWQPEETELVTAVAQQVARQIDALRLIEQAQQFRSEAEQALRRATREGWEGYLTDSKQQALGYAYQGAEVMPMQTVEEASSDEGTPMQPLLVGGQIIGKIGVQSQELNEDDADLIASVSTQLSAHLENLRLAEQREIALAATQRQAERLGDLQELGVQLSGLSDDLSAVFEAVIDASRHLLNADDAGLWLLAPDNPEEIELMYTKRADGKDLTGRRATIGQGAAGLAYRQGQVLNITDYSAWANRHLGFSDVQMNAVLAVPLISRGASIGVLIMANTLKRQSFDSDDAQIAELLAGQSAGAIERARLAQQRAAALGETQTLFELSTRLNAVRDYAMIAEAVALEGVVGTKARILVLSTENDSHGVPQRMQLLASHDYDGQSQYPLNFVFDLNQLTLAELWRYTGEVVDLPNMLTDPRVDELTRGFVAQSQNRAALIIPLRLGQTINGVVIINSDEAQPPATDAQLRIARALSGQVAVALNAVALAEQREVALGETQSLFEVVTRLNQARDYPAIANAIATDDIVGEKARVLLLTTTNDANGVPQSMQLLASHDYDNEAQYPLSFVFDLNQLTLAELWRYTGEVVDLPEMLTDPRVDELTRGFVAQSKNRAATIIPLRLGQTINGVIIINWDEVRHPASEAQLRLYRVLSGQVAVALNALQLLDRARERARREQLLREINTELSNAVDVDGVLRVAARQIGQVLGRRTVVTLGQPANGDHLEPATQPANGGRGA